MKVIFQAIDAASRKWTRPVRDWKSALNRFMIEFPDRMPVNLRTGQLHKNIYRLMHKTCLALVSLICTFILSGCSTISYQSAFPGHYPVNGSDLESDETNSYFDTEIPFGTDIPFEIVESLSVEYQLAFELGYLICSIDTVGHLTYFRVARKNPVIGYWRSPRSEKAKLLDDVILEKGYKVFSPVAYPNTRCFMPEPFDIYEVLETEYMDDWDQYFSEWQDLRSVIDNVQDAIKTLSEAVGETESDIKRVEAEISRYSILNDQTGNSIAASQRTVRVLENELGYKKHVLKIDEAVRIEILKGRIFEPRNGYRVEDDFFTSSYPREMPNYAGRPWVSSQVENPHLHPDLAAAIERVNEILSDPDQHLQGDIELLAAVKKMKVKRLQIVSAARSPLHQSILRNSSRLGDLVAGYLSSEHLFGFCVDIAMNGTPYDVKMDNVPAENRENWLTLQKVLRMAGLFVPYGMKDPNHVESLTYSRFSDESTIEDYMAGLKHKVKVMRQLREVAQNERVVLHARKMFLKNYRDGLRVRHDVLARDLKQRQEQLQQMVSEYEALRSELNRVLGRVEQLRAEKNRREAAQRHADRGPRELPPRTRPQREPREREPAPRQEREPEVIISLPWD